MKQALAITVWLIAAPALAAFPEIVPPLSDPLAHSNPGGVEKPSPCIPHEFTFLPASHSPLQQRFLADAADGRLDEFSPLEAAFVASGIGAVDSLEHYQTKAASLVAELRDSGAVAGAPRERLEAIFQFLHSRVLYGGYDLAATDLRCALDEGRFNCVSATVLFNYFAGQFGFDCRGLEMPSHAMSRVLLADGVFDVETTCPRWLHLRHDPAAQAASAAPTIGTAATADRSRAREVGPIQLAAMIYYNRGVDLLAEKRFAEAAAANATALRLDPTNATARGNLLATLNNWSIALGNAQRFDEAIAVLRRGLTIETKFNAFVQNYVHIHRLWVERLCQEKRFDEAIAVLSRAIREMPDQESLRRVQGELSRRRNAA